MFKRLITAVAVLAFFFSFASVTFAYQPHIHKTPKVLTASGDHESKATGEMDKNTEKTVNKFQSKCHIKPTRKVGSIECEKIWIKGTKELAPKDGDFE